MSEDEREGRTCLTCRHSFSFGECLVCLDDGGRFLVDDSDSCACWETADGSGCGPRRWTFG